MDERQELRSQMSVANNLHNHIKVPGLSAERREQDLRKLGEKGVPFVGKKRRKRRYRARNAVVKRRTRSAVKRDGIG